MVGWNKSNFMGDLSIVHAQRILRTKLYSLWQVYVTETGWCSSTPISWKTRKFRRFGHKLGLHCVFFIAHARNGHIATSGLKSDVTIVFLNPDFLKKRENFGDSRTFKAYIGLLNICMGFRDLGLKWEFEGQNRGRGGAILTPNELVLPSGGSYICSSFGKNRSRNATVRVLRDGQIHWQTQTDFIICPMLSTGQIMN